MGKGSEVIQGRRIKILFYTVLLLLLFAAACKPGAYKMLRRAEVLEDKGEYRKAICILNETIRLYPDELGAYINRGADYAMLGEYEIAIENYEVVIRKDPGNELALFNAGLNCIRLEDYQNAIRYFTSAVSDNSGNVKMRLIASDEYGNYPPFIVPYSEILFERGGVYYEIEHYNLAYMDFQYCIENGYQIAESYYYLGCIQEVWGKLDDAVLCYREASERGNEEAKKVLESLKK